MQGRVLAFDFRTGRGEITAADGARYQFVDFEWKAQGRPQTGIVVDFEATGRQAKSIYAISGPAAAGTAGASKSKLIAALLAFFFGGLGIHKFYLGKTKAGVITLLCGTIGIVLFAIPTIIVWLIAFIEFILYLVLSQEEFDRRYVHGTRAWF
jgi:TM2 domain-containing membrane protein YozV